MKLKIIFEKINLKKINLLFTTNKSKSKTNMENNNFKVGEDVWIDGKSLNQVNKGCGCMPAEEVEILKMTPKRFKVRWDCDGQFDPIIIYVKRVYKLDDPYIKNLWKHSI